MRLAYLLSRRRDEVTADLRRFFDVRLSDMHLGVESVTDVAVFVHEAQFIEGSSLNRVLLGEDSDWTTTNQLIAMVCDHLAIANWMQTKDGSKGKNQPKQIPRPGVEDDSTTYGSGDGLSLDEMRDWLGWAA